MPGTGDESSESAKTEVGVTSSSNKAYEVAPAPTLSLAAVPFKRRFLVPAIVLGLAEIVGIAYPLWIAFDLGAVGGQTLLSTAVPVGICACIVWLAAITTWLFPLWAAVGARRRGERVSKEAAARAYRITLKGPVRVLLLRTGLWAGAALLTGIFLYIYEGWTPQRVFELTAVATVYAYIVSCIRAVWWAQILGEVRQRLFAAGSPLRKFDDSHFRRFMLVAMIVAGGVLCAQAGFAYYFVPIKKEQYLQLQTFYPIAALIGVTTWALFARWFTYDLRRYLHASRGEQVEDAPPAAQIYRRAQALPYRLAVL
ncbi:MAG: hypothetical protein AB7L94_36065, partial [Kofleriaceae bacterium]